MIVKFYYHKLLFWRINQSKIIDALSPIVYKALQLFYKATSVFI